MHSGHCIQTNRPTRWSTRIVGAAALLALTLLGQISTLAQTKSDGKTDQNGDPLPAGALARMGTLRWRHADTVNYIAFTPDGKAVLTAGQDNVIKLWDRATGKEIRRFAIKQAIAAPQPGGMIPFGVAGPGSRVALSEDGKIVAAGLPANTIQLWDVGTGKEIRQIKGPQFGVNALIFSPDGKLIAARSGDRATYILEADTGKEILQIKPPQPKGKNGVIINFGGGFGGNAGGMAFARDSKSIVTAEVAFNMQKMTTHLLFTDLATGKEIRKLEITGRGFDPIAYSPKGKLLAYAVGNDVHLLEADTAKELHKVTVPSPCDGIVFAPDGKTLAAKGADQIIRLIDTDTGKIGHSLGSAAPPLKGNGNVVIFRGFGGTEARDFAFSQDGKTLAAGAGPTVRFFTVATGQEQALTGGHRGAVAAVVLSADGKTLVSRGVDGSIRRWDAKTGKELGQIATPPGTIDAAFAPDGKTVAIATANGGVQLLGTSDGAKLHQFKSHQNGVAALAFAADGKTFASRGALNRTIRIHDAVKGTELKEILLPGDPNPNGQIFAFGGGLAGTSGQGLAFSPDGKTIAANVNIQQFNQANNQLANSSMLLLWDVTSGKQIRKIMLPPGRVPSVLAYSPDGRLLAYENNDSTISICEIVSGKERAHLGKPAPAGQPNQMFMGGGVFVIGGGPVRAARAHPALAFSPDGTLLISRGPGNTVRVWEASHAKEIAAFNGHAAEVQSLAIAEDGKSIASGSADTTVLVWDLTSVKRTPPASPALEAKDLESLWGDLVRDDAAKAGLSITALTSAPRPTVAFLSERLKPAAPIDAKKLEKWVADLDSGSFVTRSKATSELEKLGELAAPALKKALASDPTVETRRRIEPILDKVTGGEMSAERLRLVRAIEVLERVGTPEAKELLRTIAQGAPGALPTWQAQNALDNLERWAARRPQ